MKSPASLFLVLLLLFAGLPLAAQLRLPALISSGMVLQQNDSVALWGWAGPGEKVYVKTSWNSTTDSTLATNLATWKLRVKTPAAGGPYSIEIKSRNTINLTDVMIGEVWICSGQSNMEWNYFNGTSDQAAVFPTAKNTNIRLFHIPRTGADFPQEDVRANWVSADSTTIKSFSSVGYFFGRKLQEELNVPIGLINASWGGTPAETWMPEAYIVKDATLREAASKLKTFAWWPSAAAKAFNGMIYPVTHFNIAGAIWYQGESNTETNASYKQLMVSLIDSWRNAWKKELPFYYVQIAPFNYGQTNIGALLQEQQTKLMSHPRTGMVVVTDLVDDVKDIHPSRKKPVGDRLANWALAENYGKTGISYKSPAYQNHVTVKNRLELTFTDAAELKFNGKEANGFYISGESEAWYPAKAKWEKGKLILTAKEVPKPVHARYGFGNTLIGNVFNEAGLPLIPFRTDNWVVEQKPL